MNEIWGVFFKAKKNLGHLSAFCAWGHNIDFTGLNKQQYQRKEWRNDEEFGKKYCDLSGSGR